MSFRRPCAFHRGRIVLLFLSPRGCLLDIHINDDEDDLVIQLKIKCYRTDDSILRVSDLKWPQTMCMWAWSALPLLDGCRDRRRGRPGMDADETRAAVAIYRLRRQEVSDKDFQVFER